MGRWVEVEGMKLKPYCCVACGSTPQGEDGPEPAYFCEAVDINWGDSLYLCYSCARIVGQLRGLVDVEEFHELDVKYTKLKTDYEEMMTRYEELEGRVARMLDGAKARKEVQGERKKSGTSKQRSVA